MYYSLKPFPRLLYRRPLRIRIRRWHMVGLVQTQCPWYNVRRSNCAFFFISPSLSLSFFEKIRHETNGMARDRDAARFTIEPSRDSWPIIHHLSKEERDFEGKDEISFHETSERDTRGGDTRYFSFLTIAFPIIHTVSFTFRFEWECL